MAAGRLGVDKQELTVSNGVVAAKSGGGALTYAELVGGKPFAIKVDAAAPTKNPKDSKLVGQSMARLDIPGKLTGQFTYMQDFRVPGMAHGRVIRPPTMGATLESVDESSIQHIPGIVKLVRENNFLGVVALDEWSAVRAARELVATWSIAETLPDEKKLWDHVRATRIVKDDVTSNIGDTSAALAGPGKKLSATYDFAIHTHGSNSARPARSPNSRKAN